MHTNSQLECCYTGPMPMAIRWTLRFGSRVAYRQARARAAIRALSEECLRLVHVLKWHTPDAALHDDIRRRLSDRNLWLRYLDRIAAQAG